MRTAVRHIRVVGVAPSHFVRLAPVTPKPPIAPMNAARWALAMCVSMASCEAHSSVT